MLSKKSSQKPTRSHNIHTAIERDYDRKKQQQKQEARQEKDLHTLERRMTSSIKWTQPSNRRNRSQDHATMTLDEFMQMEKAKEEKMINAKKMANARIRLC